MSTTCVKDVAYQQWMNVIYSQTKTADTAHMEIFSSMTRPFSQFLGRAWGEAMQTMLLSSNFFDPQSSVLSVVQSLLCMHITI